MKAYYLSDNHMKIMTKRLFLYHATKPGKLASIAKQGLVIGKYKSKLVKGGKYDYGKAVWLSPDVTIWNWADKKFPGDWILLAIETKYLNRKNLMFMGYEKGGWYTYWENIPPQAIYRMDTERNKEEDTYRVWRWKHPLSQARGRNHSQNKGLTIPF